MQRIIDEAEYVLTALYRMRDEVSTNPKLFDPDAGARIEEAIVRVQGLLRSTQSEMISRSKEEKLKAA